MADVADPPYSLLLTATTVFCRGKGWTHETDGTEMDWRRQFKIGRPSLAIVIPSLLHCLLKHPLPTAW